MLANDLFGADGVDLVSGVAVTTAATKGVAVYNGDGTFTYTPTAGQEGLGQFQYTITDQDGDTSTATVSITLAADSVPSVVSATNLTVDEDGFANAANDAVTARTDETDSTELLTRAARRLSTSATTFRPTCWARLCWWIRRRWTASCIRMTARA